MLNTAFQFIVDRRNQAAKAWAVDGNDTQLIQGFEGLRLKAYLDSAGVPTIGWGNTRYTNGKRVQMGDTITRETADLLLQAKIKDFALEVKSLVKVPISDNEGAALLSFQYNTGALGVSTLLKKLNAGDRAAAANEFLKWDKITVGGIKKVSKTLVNRRENERELFLKP